MKANSSQLLRIGDLARLTGKTARAIHLYEELGLLHPARRSSGGFRLYERSALERMRWIDLLHGMGFSLQEMSELLRSWWRAETSGEPPGYDMLPPYERIPVSAFHVTA